MKKKVLSVIISLSLALSFVAAPFGLTAKATQAAQAPAITDEVIDEGVDLSKTFDELKDKASKFDPSSIEDNDLKEVYKKLDEKLREIYKGKGKTYPEDELRLRSNLYWLTVFESDYDNEEVLISSVKYLDLTLNEMIAVLEYASKDYFVDADVELYRIALYMMFLNPTTLPENDKKLYDIIKEEVKKDYKDYENQDIDAITAALFGLMKMDLTKYETQARVDILKELGIDLNEYIEFKFAIVDGETADIVGDIYQTVLMRSVDEDGLKYWSGKFDSIVKSGKSKKEAAWTIIRELKAGDEFKALLAKFAE